MRRQEAEMDLTETCMKRFASCTSHVGKNEGACVPRWRGETRRGRLRAEMHRLLRGHRGRPAEGAASIETTRHYKLNRAPRYYRPRASACRRAPPTEWTSRSVAEGRRNDRASAPSRYGQRGRRTERPPLWGSDDVSAMRNYRYRHRDSPYVAERSGETNIPGRTTVGGRRRTSRSAVARKACVRARWSAVQGQRRHKRARVGFFHPHPSSVAARRAPAGRKGGPISSASGYFSSLCWSWGRRTRRRRREAARAQRGERHRPCGAARSMRRA